MMRRPGITAEQLNDFMDDLMADEFFGAGWGTNWSSAADQEISARDHHVRNHPGLRQPPTRTASSRLVMAAAFTSYFLEGALDGQRQERK